MKDKKTPAEPPRPVYEIHGAAENTRYRYRAMDGHRDQCQGHGSCREARFLQYDGEGHPCCGFIVDRYFARQRDWADDQARIRDRRRMYALGYRRQEIYRHYLKFPLVIAGAGGVLGTVLGLVFVRTMLSVFLELFNIPLTGIDYSPSVIMTSLLLPVSFLGACGWLIIRKELKHSHLLPCR